MISQFLLKNRISSISRIFIKHVWIKVSVHAIYLSNNGKVTSPTNFLCSLTSSSLSCKVVLSLFSHEFNKRHPSYGKRRLRVTSQQGYLQEKFFGVIAHFYVESRSELYNTGKTKYRSRLQCKHCEMIQIFQKLINYFRNKLYTKYDTRALQVSTHYFLKKIL